MKYKWIFNDQPKADFLSKNIDYSQIVKSLLFERGLNTLEKIESFFNPKYDRDLHDPFLLKDMDKACERVKRATGQKQKIVIYSDYDVDGVCSATVLGEYFKSINYPIEVYMPDRQKEGHGVNQTALELIVTNGAKLIITLDCGTTNIKEIEWAKNNGVDMIVVDHHQTVAGNPVAVAFINPYQEGDNYPFKGLCGTGLAFKLVSALETNDHPSLKWLLDLVAMATVADMMPLLDENRVLVKYGLFVLAKTKRVGLRKLMESAGIEARYDLETLSTNLDSFTLGFTLGPRINAASRMAHANLAYELLTSSDENKIDELVLSLNDNNRKRQQIVDKVLKDVRSRIDAYPELPSFIVEGSSDWSINLLGLVASKITERYQRPVMLYQSVDETKAKGSLRSIDGFNLIDALGSVSDFLIQYGGHTVAGGCTFEISNAEKIKLGLDNYAKNILTPELLQKKLKISAEINLAEINWSLMEALKKFEPFGMANPKSKFLSRDVEVIKLVLLGQKAEHLKIFIADKKINKTFPVLFFRHNGLAEDFKIGDTLDVVYELDINEWNGNREIQLKLIDYAKK
ncbi:MAG: single-stranded-DNA-specific exonuclease RecJ [Patescibacteria group bacterium]